MKEDYVDGRSGTIWVKEDKEGKVRGGGYELRTFWGMEIRSAVEGLGVEPLCEMETGVKTEDGMKPEQ